MDSANRLRFHERCHVIVSEELFRQIQKRPLFRVAFFDVWLREPDLNRRPSGYEPDELPDCSIPRQSWSGSIRLILGRVKSSLPHTRKPATAGILDNWYREGDSNPYTLWAQPPQGCVSTNSTTSAILQLHHETRFTFALELEVRQSLE